MGVVKYVGNKLLSFILIAIAIALFLSFSDDMITGWLAIILIIAGVYFWKHSPF